MTLSDAGDIATIVATVVIVGGVLFSIIRYLPRQFGKLNQHIRDMETLRATITQNKEDIQQIKKDIRQNERDISQSREEINRNTQAINSQPSNTQAISSQPPTLQGLSHGDFLELLKLIKKLVR